MCDGIGKRLLHVCELVSGLIETIIPSKLIMPLNSSELISTLSCKSNCSERVKMLRVKMLILHGLLKKKKEKKCNTKSM